MNLGTIDPTKRDLILNEDFKDFRPDNGGGAGPAQDWYTGPLTAAPFGSQIWRPAISGAPDPFLLGIDGLTITATKNSDGSWNSGMLNSVSPDGSKGFQVPPFFYAEATISLPNIAGTWPGFWFDTIGPPGFQPNQFGTLEIDVFEQLNGNPVIVQTVHTWNIPSPTAVFSTFEANVSFAAFHTYHVEVDQSWIKFGFDGAWRWKTPRPQVPPLPFALMIDLAMGGGFPVPTVAGPITMAVRSVQVRK